MIRWKTLSIDFSHDMAQSVSPKVTKLDILYNQKVSHILMV